MAIEPAQSQESDMLASLFRTTAVAVAFVPCQMLAAQRGKPTIEWRMPSKDDKAQPNQHVNLEIAFGDHLWTGKLLALGGKPASKVGGYTLDVFTVPQELLAARDKKPVAVASLKKKAAGKKAPDGWNVVLGKDEAGLIAWLAAP